MAENKEYTSTPQYQEEDELEINFMEYARKLWAAKKFFLKIAGIASVIGIIIALSIPKKYTAEIIFLPESSKNGGNSLSGMASMLGIGNISMGGEANALNISMTSDIIASTPFILELFETHVKTLDGKQDTTLVAYLETESTPWWNLIMSLPSKTVSGIKSLFSSDETVIERKTINPFQLTRKEMGQVNTIKSIIYTESNKKSGMTKVSVTLQDPLVAATVVDTVLIKLQKYITKYKTTKAQEDCNNLEQLYKQRRDEYYQAQEKYANYADANKNVILQRVKIEQERLQNEQNLAFQVYNQVATQLEIARAKLLEEKPVFAVLEPASVPLHPTGTSRKMILVAVVFLAVAAAAAWVLFGQDLLKTFKVKIAEGNPASKE